MSSGHPHEERESLREIVVSLSAITVVCLAALSAGALCATPGSRLYAQSHGGLLLVLVGAAMLWLLMKPRRLWGHTMQMLSALRARERLSDDQAIALTLLIDLVAMLVVAIAIVDWSAASLVGRIGGVVGVNLAVIIRSLWLKHREGNGGPEIRRRPLRRD